MVTRVIQIDLTLARQKLLVRGLPFDPFALISDHPRHHLFFRIILVLRVLLLDIVAQLLGQLATTVHLNISLLVWVVGAQYFSHFG